MGKYSECENCWYYPCRKTKLSKKYCPYRLKRMRSTGPLLPTPEPPREKSEKELDKTQIFVYNAK